MPDIGDSSGGSVIVLSKSVTDNDIANTASETNLFLYAVPAALLGTNEIIRVSMTGTYAANSGTPTMVFKVYYGSTTMFADTTFTVSAVAPVGAWEIVIYLSAHNATNLQELGGRISFGNRAAATTGLGDIGSTTAGPSHPIEGTAAEDSTTALNFRMSAQWSAAQATYSWKVKTVIVELLP